MATGKRFTDPAFIEATLAHLIERMQEFPIKVEGAKTLPYTAILQEADPLQRTLIVKLFRPLPVALKAGAWFDLMVATQELRFEGRISLLGQDGHLRYRFDWPVALMSSDRRLWKRYLFRPRENIQVTAQDCAIPSHGLTGPLTSLSQGGFSFRLDRMLRLEDGMPIRPQGNLFTVGEALSPVRIHNLTRKEPLEVRGQIMRIQEADSEIHLALQFNELNPEVSALLTRILAAREQQIGTGSGGAGRGRGAERAPRPPGGGPGDPEDPAAGEAEDACEEEDLGAEPTQADAGLDQLRLLDRRTARVLLAAPEGEEQSSALHLLQAAGFWRVERVADLPAALETCARAVPPIRLLLVDLATGKEGLEAVQAVRRLESQLDAFGALPLAYLTQAPDPLLELLGRPATGTVAREGMDPATWAAVLDRLLGLS